MSFGNDCAWKGIPHTNRQVVADHPTAAAGEDETVDLVYLDPPFKRRAALARRYKSFVVAPLSAMIRDSGHSVRFALALTVNISLRVLVSWRQRREISELFDTRLNQVPFGVLPSRSRGNLLRVRRQSIGYIFAPAKIPMMIITSAPA